VEVTACLLESDDQARVQVEVGIGDFVLFIMTQRAIRLLVSAPVAGGGGALEYPHQNVSLGRLI
jgi:hypothetical protein